MTPDKLAYGISATRMSQIVVELGDSGSERVRLI